MYRQDTLAGLKSSLLYKATAFSAIPVAEAAEKAKVFIQKAEASGITPRVEAEALTFYLLSHAMAELEKKYHPHEILPEQAQKLVAHYRNHVSDLFPRLVYYTLIVCTRESRHVTNKSAVKAHTDKVTTEYYPFLANLPSGSSSAASYFMNNPPKMSLGQYITAVSKVFHNGSFHGGYGGPAWGRIADALKKLVLGDISPLTFIDTAWTLAHNNGPMFNKGFLFGMSGKKIIKVLDIQRAGQIPQYIYGTKQGWEISEGFVNNLHHVTWSECEKEIPTFKGIVDWTLVARDGVGGYYHTEHEHQKQSVTVAPSGEIKPPPLKVWVNENEYAEAIEEYVREAA